MNIVQNTTMQRWQTWHDSTNAYTGINWDYLLYLSILSNLCSAFWR